MQTNVITQGMIQSKTYASLFIIPKELLKHIVRHVEEALCELVRIIVRSAKAFVPLHDPELCT